MTDSAGDNPTLQNLDLLIARTVGVVGSMERHVAALLSLDLDTTQAFDALDAAYHSLMLYRRRRQAMLDEFDELDSSRPSAPTLDEHPQFALTPNQVELLRRLRAGAALWAGGRIPRIAEEIALLSRFGLVRRNEAQEWTLTSSGWACLHRHDSD